jgi:hypothetical protein
VYGLSKGAELAKPPRSGRINRGPHTSDGTLRAEPGYFRCGRSPRAVSGSLDPALDSPANGAIGGCLRAARYGSSIRVRLRCVGAGYPTDEGVFDDRDDQLYRDLRPTSPGGRGSGGRPYCGRVPYRSRKHRRVQLRWQERCNALGLMEYLTALTLVLELIFASCAFVYVRRLLKRKAVPLTTQVRSVPTVLGMLRKSQPMSQEELALAEQVIDARSR